MPLVPQQLESSKDIIARIQVLLFDEEWFQLIAY